jgi:hypothetical protein
MATKVISENTTRDFAGETDARMLEGTPTASGSGSIETLSATTAVKRRSLIKFQGLSNIIGPVVVSSATLQLYVDIVDGDAIVELWKALRDWAAPTWNTYDGTNNWTTAGCGGSGTDRAAARSSALSVVVANVGSYVSFSPTELVADVESWINSGSNFGWLVMNQSDGAAGGPAVNFAPAAGVDTHRPKLTVVYTTPTNDEQMTADLYF